MNENYLYKRLNEYCNQYKKKIESSKEDKIKKSLIFLKNKAKTLEDIYNNSKYILFDEVNFDEKDLKLIDEKSKKIISDFIIEITKQKEINKNILEPIINNLIKKHDTNYKGVGQPLRIALTGSKFGPGIYDIMISLGKLDIEKRLSKII